MLLLRVANVRGLLGILVTVALGGCGDDASVPSSVPSAGTGAPPSAGHALVYCDALEAVLLVNAGLGGLTQPPSSEPTRLYAWARAMKAP